MLRFWIAAFVLGIVLQAVNCPTAQAQLTPEYRKELSALSKTISGTGALIRKKELAEAEQTLSSAADKLKEIMTASNASPNDPAIKRVNSLLEKQQAALEKAGGKVPGGGASSGFMAEVAPLVVARCVQCHGATNPRNGLRLDSFAGWRAGGRNGPVLIPGNPNRSLILARVHAEEGKGRMPPNGEALTDEEKKKLSDWIDGGAKFDGASEATPLAALIEAEEAKNVVIPKPKGGEEVLFTRDIAPWFTNLCLNCHNSRRKSGGLSVETFFDIMKGGESGEVIIPGDMENSRLFLLVGGKELPRMPQGQARITRKNYDDLVKWFKEGNTYDGADPRTRISTFVPTEAQMAQQSFASVSDADLQKLRIERTEDQFRKAISKDSHSILTTDDFYLVGNVDEKRLAQVQKWAEDQLKVLQKSFDDTNQPWRGRLAIFVLKDSFSFQEFQEVIERRRPDPDSTSLVKVTPGQEDAYVVVQDTGENASSGRSLQVSVIEQVTAAFVLRNGNEVPDWLARGSGLVMAEQIVPDRKRAEELERTAAVAVAGIQKSEDLFANDRFSQAESAAIGYSLSKFLMATGGPNKFNQFVKAVSEGTAPATALQSVYGTQPQAVATGYLSKMKSR